MITDKEIEKALDYLRDNVDEAAQARANRLYMEQWIKTVKAKVQTNQLGLSAAAAEAIAYSSAEYLSALDAMKVSIETDERHRFLREAADAKIRAWQTQSSNYRAEKV